MWNPESTGLRALFRQHRPAVAHFHNTFPLVSPSAYRAARAEGVPVVQTLHNFRLCCPNALFHRAGRPCEDCLGKAVPWPGVVHACYRGSRGATAAIAGMLTVHRALGTYQCDVDVYIALSRFARDKFVAGGLPAERIVIKPNFPSPSRRSASMAEASRCSSAGCPRRRAWPRCWRPGRLWAGGRRCGSSVRDRKSTC